MPASASRSKRDLSFAETLPYVHFLRIEGWDSKPLRDSKSGGRWLWSRLSACAHPASVAAGEVRIMESSLGC